MNKLVCVGHGCIFTKKFAYLKKNCRKIIVTSFKNSKLHFFRNDLPSGKMSQWCLSGPRPDQIRPHDAELNVRKSENKKRRNRKEQNSKLKYKFGKYLVTKTVLSREIVCFFVKSISRKISWKWFHEKTGCWSNYMLYILHKETRRFCVSFRQHFLNDVFLSHCVPDMVHLFC